MSNEPEAYLETLSNPTRELFRKIVNSCKSLTIFAKSSFVDIQLGAKYASVNITLTLTFSRTVHRKLMNFFKVLTKD